VQELVDALSAGDLTDEKWEEVHRRVTTTVAGETRATDYLSEMENRISRRHLQEQSSRIPLLFIEPFDSLVKGIGPCQLGLALAPMKRGKSLFLLWLAVAYMLQKLNVLFITLEDPQADMEDRLDAIISGIRLKHLNEKPKLFRERFAKFTRLLRARMRIVDGTQGGVTVQRIEQILLQERNHGFYADAVIVDYDDEIAPTKKKQERRFELADIYRDLRQLASRQKQIVWTAAQTQRGTEGLKILSGDKIAEDISKIRKVTMAIGLGQGDWGPESIYLWVTAHKFDKQHVGCNIMADRERMLIYDAEKTRKAIRAEEDTEDMD
jgi:replicative DNA helicase